MCVCVCVECVYACVCEGLVWKGGAGVQASLGAGKGVGVGAGGLTSGLPGSAQRLALPLTHTLPVPSSLPPLMPSSLPPFPPFLPPLLPFLPSRLWKTFTDCFNCLPVAALIDEKILCMHGGLSPELKSLEQVSAQDTGRLRICGIYCICASTCALGVHF